MLGAVGRVGSVGRSSVKAGGSVTPIKTYADWVAHVNAQSATDRGWQSYQYHATQGLNKTTASTATPSGIMYGSSFGSWMNQSVSPERAIQHGLPSQAEWNNQRTAGRIMLYTVAYGAQQSELLSISRNGYQSQGEALRPYDTMYMTELSWWDAALGKPRTWNPSTNPGAPMDYLLRGWTN